MKKITFLVGGLEPGANGVGDYSRLLAAEIERQQPQIRCQLVALHDSQVNAPHQADGAANQLRLPMGLPWPQRVELARSFVDDFAPDWVSLQFVPYAFHHKGVVNGLTAHLQPIIGKRPLHIMFHELWIGETREARLKERMVGQLQRHYVLQMLRQLRPDAISTSNGAYKAILARDGFPAAILPLYGNIPIVSQADAETEVARQFESFYQEKAATIEPPQPLADCWTGTFFGSLYSGWQAQPLLGHLIKVSAQREQRLCLMAIGRLGGAGEAIWDEMRRNYADDVTFVSWGEQPTERISRLLQKADFGIAASPWQLIGKSGSTATLLDHGLPVIVNRDDWHWRGTGAVTSTVDPLLHHFDGASKDALTHLQTRAPQESLPAVAAEFLRQLDAGERAN